MAAAIPGWTPPSCLATPGFESREVLRQAQALFAGSKAGLADCLILAKATGAGCESLATFDWAMQQLPGAIAP